MFYLTWLVARATLILQHECPQGQRVIFSFRVQVQATEDAVGKSLGYSVSRGCPNPTPNSATATQITLLVKAILESTI